MKPKFDRGNVRANCPDCGVPTTFEYKGEGGELGSITVNHPEAPSPDTPKGPTRVVPTIYKLLRCSVCHRPGIATVVGNVNYTQAVLLDSFWPAFTPAAVLPDRVPTGIVSEFREAERCLGAEALRAAAALLRSALEKTLKANGFHERNLYERIEAASRDGVITSARRQRAHDLVRTLGNDVLHDDWRPVDTEEAQSAHHYVGRVIEDLYDDRDTVEGILKSKERVFDRA